MSYRQSKRLWRRYQAAGAAGLGHRLRGRPSARRRPAARRAQALALYAEERYADFAPPLLAEQRARQKLVVAHKTVRRGRRRQPTHRQWRERKPSFGAMGQLDGSPRDWFRGARPPVRADGAGG